MITSKQGIDLIKQFEGVRLKPYKDVIGIWTYGIGAIHDINGKPVTASTEPLTIQQAEQLLAKQLKTYEDFVNKNNKIPLTQNQFDSCVSLCYNIGPGNFLKSSVLRYCNKKAYKEAADGFLLWNKAGGKVIQGLINRRIAERSLFLS